MAVKSNLPHGFKAKAERLAIEYRKELGIHPCDPLCAFKLAEHLAVGVFEPSEITTDSDLLSDYSGGSKWSAWTQPTATGNTIIVYNPFHSAARQQSDVMHELAHIICKHDKPDSKYNFSLPVGMRDLRKEDEAECLGSTLQLATPCLLWASKRGLSFEEIGAYFNASYDMVKYRMNITGIARRLMQSR